MKSNIGSTLIDLANLVKTFSLEQLATQYAKYRDEICLEELKRRDKLNKSVKNQPDNQMVFDFHKEVASVEETTNNASVKDEWNDAYETGYRIGERIGLKQGLEQAERGVPGVPKCDCEEEK